ncbi:MAG: hypothetical protein LBQ12_00955 [Deltaproteobacteria bacterium]|nr:hypothetical protein [Deltaproteobacteria bacterium]
MPPSSHVCEEGLNPWGTLKAAGDAAPGTGSVVLSVHPAYLPLGEAEQAAAKALASTKVTVMVTGDRESREGAGRGIWTLLFR